MPKANRIGHNGAPRLDADGIVDFPAGMPKMHYFMCDIAALRKAIIDKPLDIRGGFISALLAMYEYMEPLPADDHAARARCGISDARLYKRVKQTLLDFGLVHKRPSGRISNTRFEEEITLYVTEFRNRSKAGKEREERAREQRSCDAANAQLTASYGLATAQLTDSYRLASEQLTPSEPEKPKEINDRPTSIQVSVSPHIRDRDRDRNKDTPIPPRTAGFEPRADEVCVGGNVWVNCDTVRHPGFTISLAGLTMQLVTANIGLSKTAAEPIARDAAVAHALQWGAEIDAGKLPGSVVPSSPANFIRGSVVAQFRKGESAKATQPLAERKREDARRQIAAIVGRAS